jgi:hypothetical protein
VQTLGTAGAEALPLRALHLRAQVEATTHTKTAKDWLEELAVEKGAEAVAAWRREAEAACADAVRAYEKARGDRPCVVPGEVA